MEARDTHVTSTKVTLATLTAMVVVTTRRERGHGRASSVLASW
jgi:hypothetical protein